MRLTLLQKEMIFWMVIFLICTGVGIYYINHTPNEYPGMIRLHVVANSDAPQDQALKLKVRNEIIKFMEGQDSLEKTRTYLNKNLGNIEKISEKIIDEEGMDYPARAQLKVSYIPKKSYEDLTLPAGNYEALKVTLGRGEGRNWWCVIFPQLCLIGEKNGTEKIVLKSKVKEIMKEDLQEKAREKHHIVREEAPQRKCR